jgi:hypothetical protein
MKAVVGSFGVQDLFGPKRERSVDLAEGCFEPFDAPETFRERS